MATVKKKVDKRKKLVTKRARVHTKPHRVVKKPSKTLSKAAKSLTGAQAKKAVKICGGKRKPKSCTKLYKSKKSIM